MKNIKEYEETLSKVLEQLPEGKVVEVIDFATFLLNQYAHTGASHVDTASLLIQQKALKRIWDNPEEDIYEL